MQVKSTKDEILIRLPASTDIVGLQRLLDFLKYELITSKSLATEKQIDELAEDSKSEWWTKNKELFMK